MLIGYLCQAFPANMQASKSLCESDHWSNVIADAPRLTEADLAALLQTVQRYAGHTLSSAVAKPQTAMTQELGRALVNQLIQLGVLNEGPEPAYGLWDDARRPCSRRLRR